MDDFRFTKGLDFSQSPSRTDNQFDWSVTADSVTFFVTLPTGPSKRGTTAFHTEMPIFKCLEGTVVPCTKFPSAAANTYYVDLGQIAVLKLPQSTCSSILSSFSISNTKCWVFKG